MISTFGACQTCPHTVHQGGLTRDVLQGRNVVALPLKLKDQKSACVTTLTIMKRFEFESQLLRSGVLAVASAGSTDEVLFFVKGAPASIEHLLGRGSVPPSYRQVCLPRLHISSMHTVISCAKMRCQLLTLSELEQYRNMLSTLP